MLAIADDGEALFVVSRDEQKLCRLSARDLSAEDETGTSAEPHGIAFRPSSDPRNSRDEDPLDPVKRGAPVRPML